jgi:hypothetical protein
MLTDVDGTLLRRRLRGFFWTQTKRTKKWALYQMVMDSVAHHSWGKSLYPFLYVAWIIFQKHMQSAGLDGSCVALFEAESARCALDKLEMATGHNIMNIRNPWYCTLIFMLS